MLKLEHFSCGMGGETLLKGSLMVAENAALTVLVGGSGSGKTRFLRALAGLDDGLQGRINWNGETLRGSLLEHLPLGMLFQNSALLDDFSVSENLTLAARRGGDPGEAQAGLRWFGLEQAGDKLPGQLSEGMKRRVALIRAGLGDPRLILLDEPLAGLEAEQRRRVRQWLQHWLDAGRTVLAATHLPEVFAELGGAYYRLVAGVLEGPWSWDEFRREDDTVDA
jgi:ABC-type multidrug transport system ATPase subunit